MAEHNRIAVAGAGNLGLQVIKALVRASYPVTVLTRSLNHKPLDVDESADVKYATVDYASRSSLTTALQGHLGVVSTITSTAIGQQDTLIDAAAAAGVRRFIPAEFGSDMANPKTQVLPVYGFKAAAQAKLLEVAKFHTSFTWTAVRNGVFLDWGLQYKFLLNQQDRSITIFDDGEEPWTTTTLATVGKAVVGVFQHLDETKDRAVYIHDTVLTQKKLLQLAKAVDTASGQEWKVDYANSEEHLKKCMDVLANNPSEEQVGQTMYGLLPLSIYTKGYGGDSSSKSDNALLGIQTMTDAEVRAVVAGNTGKA
ncbi:hypothetical protein LTR62_004646 [Meristemomyces frigidus]|uniref:NmrA-like domain-containing protein n=1 Tax=Meristemomyces frigidus TaxID=1508187 RepID=A0AAN7TGR7_9PEZI|nr:hypothetical protein LTR62_004646 [Meristemomyces frigidus]